MQTLYTFFLLIVSLLRRWLLFSFSDCTLLALSLSLPLCVCLWPFAFKPIFHPNIIDMWNTLHNNSRNIYRGVEKIWQCKRRNIFSFGVLAANLSCLFGLPCGHFISDEKNLSQENNTTKTTTATPPTTSNKTDAENTLTLTMIHIKCGTEMSERMKNCAQKLFFFFLFNYEKSWCERDTQRHILALNLSINKKMEGNSNGSGGEAKNN